MYKKTCPSGSVQHTVKSGDTLWKLSQEHGVSVQNILDLNPGVDPLNLQIGSTLCIPAASLPLTGTCPNGASSYIVRAGDTFWNISQNYGVSLQSILDLNPGVDPRNLQIGSTICIPSAVAAPAPVPPKPVPVSPKPAPMPPMPPVPIPTAPSLPVTCPKGAFSYTIQSGDTLWKLSQNYGVTVQSILNLNPGVDPRNLQIGSILCIPPVAAAPAPMPPKPPVTMPTLPVTCPNGAFSYTVQSGDTLWKLSQTYGVTVQSILNLNPGVEPRNLQIGSTICIPSTVAPPPPKPVPVPPMPPVTVPIPTAPSLPVTCPKGAFSYTIQSGDTFWKLSQNYGVSLQSILDLNPGMDPMHLQIGSTLCIPSTVAPPPPKPVPVPPKPPVTAPIPTAPSLPVTCPKGAFSYTVQSGDTFWKLSQNYGVSLQSILDLNPGMDPMHLQIGSTLCIPTEPLPSANAFLYRIQKCDTICKIAKKFYVSVKSILQKNPGINPGCLQAGTYIYIPMNCCAENTCRYAVKAGDTLNGIANRFCICPSALITANPNIDFQNLVRCQIICIPIA